MRFLWQQCILLLFVGLFLATSVFAQQARYEVSWQINPTPINLDSLGRDYQLVGGDRASNGSIVHRGVY